VAALCHHEAPSTGGVCVDWIAASFFNNTLSNNLLFVRFLLGGQYAKVGDDGVRRLCAFLRALFWFFAAGSVAFVAVMLAVHRA
jgi:hypothetical protein